MGALAIAALPVHAQAPPALHGPELAAAATMVVGRHTFFGPELGLAARGAGGGQGRLAVTAAAGSYEHVLGVRCEATAQFLLRPGEQSGAGPYAGLGLAYVGAQRVRGASYLTALLGVESAPAARAGWYGEIGLGGGVRLALGRRFRHFPPGW
ncbi:MAG TPA: hypothetical protein VEU73_05860 [Gemmatimonadales bacterium]|nr:hypothetical protein [Gemmatimonadales bacterium]